MPIRNALDIAARAEGGPIFNRAAVAAAVKPHTGPIHSAVAGRTDHLKIEVPSGAYVLPADIVSAMGEGNTAAGFRIATDMFGQPFRGDGAPYGVSPRRMPYGVTKPRATGGSTSTVPIVAAGGEFVIHPDRVLQEGKGSLEDGHKILDAFVNHYRAKTIQTLKKLPPPAKD